MAIRAVVLAQGKFGSFGSKTANDLLIYNGRLFDVVALLDESKAGKTSREFLPFTSTDVPIVARLEDASKFKPEALVIGVAPIGGRISSEYRRIVREAILKGLDVWSGMHTFLSDDPELMGVALRTGSTLHDLRRPPADLQIWTGEVSHTKAARVTIMGTDCDVGKNITTMELAHEASKLGFSEGTVATGQTMLMLGTNAGAVIDSIPADFGPGEVERQILTLDKEGKDIIFIEGQAAVLHPAYGQVSVAILYGSQPDAICLAHDPFREWRGGFEARMPKLEDEISAIETLCPTTRVVAVSLMGFNHTKREVSQAARQVKKETGLPASDAIRQPDRLAKAIFQYLILKKRIRPKRK
jgi:D-glutamate N-acetyltransferase